jgi:penicillin-binding protein 1A
MKVAHQNVAVADLPGSQPQGGFLSGLFGGNLRYYSQPNKPQVSDANPSYIPPAVNSPNPYPQARPAVTQTAVRPEASSGLDGWLIDRVFGGRR